MKVLGLTVGARPKDLDPAELEVLRGEDTDEDEPEPETPPAAANIHSISSVPPQLALWTCSTLEVEMRGRKSWVLGAGSSLAGQVVLSQGNPPHHPPSSPPA